MNRGDDMRSADEIFRDALPSISFAPVNETPKPSGKVLGREFYHDSAGRTILGDKETTDQMGGGGTAPDASEGDFTDTIPDPAPSTGYDVVLITEFDITLVSAEFFGGTLGLAVTWNGGDVSFTAGDNGIVGPADLGDLTLGDNECFCDGEERFYDCNQVIPAGSFIQISVRQVLDSSDVTYTLHYTRL